MAKSSETMTINDVFLRSKMKDMLLCCTEKQQDIFKKMYKSIDKIKSEQMDWAFKQIETTLKNNADGSKDA